MYNFNPTHKITLDTGFTFNVSNVHKVPLIHSPSGKKVGERISATFSDGSTRYYEPDKVRVEKIK